MGNPDHGATAVNFMAILQSIDYSKFERFSNIAEIKGAEKNTGQKTQLIYRKLKLLITEKFQSHFEVILGIRTIKTT